jgi:hypothetical protein
VCAPSFNARGQAVGMRLHLDSAAAVTMLRPGVKDAFTLPLTPLTNFTLNGASTGIVSGNITLLNGSTMSNTNGPINYSGAISGTGHVRISPTGNTNATISGSASNTFNGILLLDGFATLFLNKTAGADAVPAGGLTIGQNMTADNAQAGRLVQLQAANQINHQAPVTFIGNIDRTILRLDAFNDAVQSSSATTGTSTLGGITLQFASGYTPNSGDLFDLLDWTNLTGPGTLNNETSAISVLSDSLLNLPSLGGTLAWDTSFWSSHGVVAIYTNVIPEPSRTLCLLAGLFTVLLRRQRWAPEISA